MNDKIRIFDNGDGTYKLLRQNTTSKLWEALSMSGSGTLKQNAIWTTNSNELSQCWVLERVNYQRGDVDCNGEINSDDATLILQVFAGSIKLTEVQKFLGDVNGDKKVNSDDASIILKKFAGLD